MQTQRQVNGRNDSLREFLNHERNLALARVREYRTAQEGEALPPPSDELDAARTLADVETHASLIERAEERLRAIDFALNLLERGRYGKCAKCGEEIPLERLKAVPFAAYCVDCQQRRNHARRVGEGKVDEPFAHQWNLPEEMAESTEASHDEFIPVSEEGPAEEEPDFRTVEPLGGEKGKTRRRGPGVHRKGKQRT
jgi:RNA polymerase-binding protein DksA